MLAAVAGVVRRSAGPDDTVASWGGGAFLVLLPGTDLAGAEALAERIRRRVEVTPVAVAGATLTVTVSAGCAQGRHRGGADVVARAAAALRRAKDGGRNRVAASRPGG